jgi:hypothetical protein
MLGIPVIFPCGGGSDACDPFYKAFEEALQMFVGSAYFSMMSRYVHCVLEGTHVSNLSLRYRLTWPSIEQQVSIN